MDTTAKSLNKEFLNHFYKEMVDDIGEIFQIFLDEMPLDLSLLKENVDKGNFKRVAEILHKIAPSFNSIGLPQLTLTVKEIEFIISTGDVAEIPQRISAFQENYKEYLPAIIEECNRLNANKS